MNFGDSWAMILIIAVLSLPTAAQVKPANGPAEYPTRLVREEQHLNVGGYDEVWRLVWSADPKPYCEVSDTSLTCPCTGFAYGEVGDLYVVRLRNGSEIDRLHLTPFFKETPGAAIQRWPVEEKDWDLFERDDSSKVVEKRRVSQIMQFADYDHDGAATEFYLQTDALPCGKSLGLVVGISKQNPQLHAFGAASKPGEPLYLFKWEWEALRDAKSGPIKVLDWPCGDHGAETETDVELNWSAAGITAIQREYTCPTGEEERKLLGEEPLPQ